MRAWFLLMSVVSAPLAAQPLVAPEPSRFEVRGQTLQPVASASTNGRFQLRSSLSPRSGGEEPLKGVGFALSARLLAKGTALCPGLADIFKDGFEG
jgi:hypothetical protein